MSGRLIDFRFFGGFSCQWSDGAPLDIRGNKHRAMLSILALAKNGTQSRAWLQETLWSRSGKDHQSASLRRAIADLRKLFGPAFDAYFAVTSADITLNPAGFRVLGTPADGPLLDGLNLPEPRFERWLEGQRNHQASRALRLLDARAGLTPRIAVIPFLPRGFTPELSKAGDWLACELTRTLSRSYLVEVVSHLSSRQMDAGLIDLNTAKAVLKADYLVSGTFSVRGDRISMQLDLTQTASGRLLFSENFDTTTDAIIGGTSPAFHHLGTRIGYEIFASSIELAEARSVVTVENHALLMSAIGLMHQHKLEGFGRARVYLRELIERNPTAGILQAWLAKWNVLAVSQGWSTDPAQNFQKAAECADRALGLSPDCAFCLAISGMIKGGSIAVKDGATQLFEHSLELDPNNSLAWLLYSRLQMFDGNGTMALKLADRACDLSPLDPYKYFYDIIRASAFSVCGDNQKALELAENSIKANPRHTSSHRVKTIALQLLDRGNEARDAADILQKLEPNLTVADYKNNHPAGDCAMVRDWARALRTAGIAPY